jgi:prepilin-type N-terminal cleavage/methylation domain-containing protein
MTRTRRTGFTLIETVAAIVILAVAVPPMLWAVTESQRQRMNPMMVSKARWLAVERIEDVIADRHSTTLRGYDWVVNSNDYVVENPGDIAGNPGFKREVKTLTETGADLDLGNPVVGGGYLTVTVTVGWVDAKGDNQTLDISTVLTDYTP